MLGQAGRLSERQRVKPRLSLLFIRIRYFVVSLIPWSEAMSHPPSPQNTFHEPPLFSDDWRQGVNELNSWHFLLSLQPDPPGYSEGNPHLSHKEQNRGSSITYKRKRYSGRREQSGHNRYI